MLLLATFSSTYAAKQDFLLINQTGVDIQEVYVAPHSSEEWAEDVMGKDMLVSGKSVKIHFERESKTKLWDLKVVDKDGKASVWQNLEPAGNLESHACISTVAKRPPKSNKSVPTSARFLPMKSRLWLMFQPKLVTQPVVFELGKKFEVVTNIRQASVNEEIGLVSIELDGERARNRARDCVARRNRRQSRAGRDQHHRRLRSLAQPQLNCNVSGGSTFTGSMFVTSCSAGCTCCAPRTSFSGVGVGTG